MKKIIAITGVFGLFASQAIISSAAYFNTQPIVQCQTQITNTLSIGSENNDVYVLQGVLVSAGFLHAMPNGYFGHQTQSALESFQMNNSLRANGVVGEATRNAINERLCDSDLIDNSVSYNQYGDYSQNQYGYSNSITYVENTDPFVRVITPTETTPVIYATPQSNVSYNFPSSFYSTSANTPVLLP